MKKVALYGRVSTDEQRDHGLSIAAQKQTLYKYCEENGYTNTEEYFDEGVSAAAMKKRKQFQRLLDDCRAGKIELILFTKLDRWFRHVGKYHVIQDELTALGVPWKAVLEPIFETVTALGKGHINFYLTTAQIEVDRTSERIHDINQYKLSQGHCLTGNMPYGYVVGEDKKPAFDPETVEIARYILENYEKLQSKRGIMRDVQERFGADIGYNLITTMLHNKKYTGIYRGIQNYYPPLISVAQYEKNQEIAKKNIKEYQDGNARNTYIFTGLLKCGVCGRTMGGSDSGPYVSKKGVVSNRLIYRCQRTYRSSGCTNHKTTLETVVEKILLKQVKDDLENIKLQVETRKCAKESAPKINVDEVKDELERLNFMFQKRRISEDLYDSEYERLENLLNQAAVDEPSPQIDLIFHTDFETVYRTFTKEEKRLFWRGILKYATIYGREIKPYFLV